MSVFKNYLRDFNTYTRPEKRGIFAMLFLVGLSLVILFAMNFMDAGSKGDFSKFKSDTDHFYAMLEKDSISVAKEKSNFSLTAVSGTGNATAPFYFNPNNLPDSMWMKLGLSEKQVASIKKYEEKGGKFRSKDDVKKMYVISDEMYTRIEPFIQIEEIKKSIVDSSFAKLKNNKSDTIYKETKKYKSVLFPIDINTASTIELEMLPAVGPTRAKLIYDYKIMLGGYINIEQLKEVFGMNDSVYDAIKEKVIVKHGFKPNQININTDAKEKLKHPYIPYKLAEIIVNNRKKTGNFNSIEDIKSLPLMKAEIYSRLKPYIKAE